MEKQEDLPGYYKVYLYYGVKYVVSHTVDPKDPFIA